MLYSRMVLQFGYSIGTVVHREYGCSAGGLGEDTTKEKGKNHRRGGKGWGFPQFNV